MSYKATRTRDGIRILDTETGDVVALIARELKPWTLLQLILETEEMETQHENEPEQMDLFPS